MGWFSFGDALGGANLALGAYGLFSGSQNSKKAAKQAEQEAQRIRAISDDIANEGPMFQAQYNSQKGRIDRDFANNIKTLRTRSQRDIARTGGVGFLTPERQDEAIASSLLRGQIDNQEMAKNKAREVLLNSIGVAQQTQAMRNQANQYQQQGQQQLYGGLSSLLYGANALGQRGGWGGNSVSNLWGGNERVVTSPSGTGGRLGRV